MNYNPLEIKDLDHLLSHLRTLYNGDGRWVFRGMSKSEWPLKTSFERYYSNIRFTNDIEPEFYNKRIFSQQGLFAVPGTLRCPFEENLRIYEESYLNDSIIKFMIPYRLKGEIIEYLHIHNLIPHSVYSDFEGFLKYVKNFPQKEYFTPITL
jgi:hypothetical protein